MAERTARLPRWVAAKNVLLARIDSGEWPPGGRLPAEPGLSAEIGVSRATLREALRSLSEEGYLDRRPGAGTRVADRRVLGTSLNNNTGVADVIRSMGMAPGTSSLQFRLAEAPGDVARDLALPDRQLLAVIERVRTADGNPVVFSTHYFPPQGSWNGGALLAGFDGESLYTLLEARAGITIAHATATIAPAVADSALAERLATAPGALLMHFRQVDYDKSGRAVILSDEFYLGAAFQFTVFRRGPRPVSSGIGWKAPGRAAT